MIVKVARRDQVNDILESTKSDTFHKNAVRVSRQVPTEIRHQTAKLYHLASVAKVHKPDANIYVKYGNLYINNVKRKTPLAPPTLTDILQVTNEENKLLNSVKFYTSNMIMEKGSTFRAFATPERSLNDARIAYRSSLKVN